jgi:hypothetical protein
MFDGLKNIHFEQKFGLNLFEDSTDTAKAAQKSRKVKNPSQLIF